MYIGLVRQFKVDCPAKKKVKRIEKEGKMNF